MHAKTPPPRPLPPPAFQPLTGPPAQWRPQVLHHLTRTAQQQRAILIHDDPVFAHHLQATLEHADLRVCSLTPTTHPRSAHAATVVLSPDLHAVWQLLLHEDALTGTVRPTTLFLLLSPDQMLVPYLPEHVPFVIASSRALHVQTIIFDLDAQLGGEHGRYQYLGHTAACRTE